MLLRCLSKHKHDGIMTLCCVKSKDKRLTKRPSIQLDFAAASEEAARYICVHSRAAAAAKPALRHRQTTSTLIGEHLSTRQNYTICHFRRGDPERQLCRKDAKTG